MLRLLVAVAPSADSDVLFLPQQRTIFLLQSLQKWFAAEDDNVELSDEVHAMLAELFVVLAPVVQDRTGGHWDFMFDVLESNIEVRCFLLSSRSCRLKSHRRPLWPTNLRFRASFRACACSRPSAISLEPIPTCERRSRLDLAPVSTSFAVSSMASAVRLHLHEYGLNRLTPAQSPRSAQHRQLRRSSLPSISSASRLAKPVLRMKPLFRCALLPRRHRSIP